MTRAGASAACFVAALALTLGTAGHAAPARAADIAKPLAAAGYRQVSLVRHGKGHLVLAVRLNGVEGRFVLDTGATRTLVEASGRERFKLGDALRPAGAATGAGGGGIAVHESPGNQLDIGGYSDPAFTALVMSLAHVNDAFERRGEPRIDGVIGADVLERGQAVVDYASNTLYLRPTAAAPAGDPRANQPEHTQ